MNEFLTETSTVICIGCGVEKSWRASCYIEERWWCCVSCAFNKGLHKAERPDTVVRTVVQQYE